MALAADAAADVVLFDGVCNLCTASVQFVIQRDSRKRFHFASLQSAVAQDLLAGHATQGTGLDSVILIAGGRIYRRSSAALLIARRLDGFWPLLSVLLLIPRPLRDALYDWIGRRRYRFFGRRQLCWTPNPEIAERFLDA